MVGEGVAVLMLMGNVGVPVQIRVAVFVLDGLGWDGKNSSGCLAGVHPISRKTIKKKSKIVCTRTMV